MGRAKKIGKDTSINVLELPNGLCLLLFMRPKNCSRKFLLLLCNGAKEEHMLESVIVIGSLATSF